MSLFSVLANFFRVCADLVRVWFWSSMLHKLISRVIYFPSVLRMSLMVGPERRWYDRVDDTVLLGALPFRSQTKEVRICVGGVAFAWAFLWVFLRLASFPGLPRLQFLIACSVQKRSWLRFAYCKRSKAGFPPPSPTPAPEIESWAGPGTEAARLLEHTPHEKY